MELILNLGCLETIGKNKQSYGLFLCPFCFKKVIKTLGHGLRDKSCGCVKIKLTSLGLTGKNLTEKHIQNISKALKGKKHTEEHNQKIGLSQKGRKRTEEQRKNILKSKIGKKFTKVHIENLSISHKGKKQTEESKKKRSESLKGEKHYNWQGGKSFEEYGMDFNKELKQYILERDNYTCQDPNCDGNHKKLHIHHIDYNKKNNNSENLITLCSSCHMKTNKINKRQFYTEYYQTIMKEKYK